MTKVSRRITVAVVLLIPSLYVLAHAYMWLNENSMVFAGANLSVDEPLIISEGVSIPWDTLRVTTEDGVGILLIESALAEAPGAPWIIYFYGQAGRLADGKSIAMYDLFRSVGLNVLAMDYRGYGASEKEQPTEAGVYADARAAWQHLSQVKGVPASRVLIYGYSMGGCIATQLATEISPAGLITEGTFTSAPDMARMQYPWVATVAMRNRFENLEKAMSLPAPWLIFHGQRDERVPFEHAEALAGTTAGMRRLIPLECGHQDALELQGDSMEEALRDFLVEVFGPGQKT